MELTPYIGDKPVRPEAFSIVVNEADMARITRMVTECESVRMVANTATLQAATAVVGRLKSLINEIIDARKAAERPFLAVEQAIKNKAAQVAHELQDENKRILGLINAYVAQIEAKAKAEAQEKEAKRQAEVERLQKIAEEARAAQLKAEAEAKEAKDEIARLAALERANRLAQQLEEARLDAELASEVANIGNSKQAGLITGGRVDHPWKFKLVDLKAAVDGGAWRCLRCEPDILICRDVVRRQLERNPNGVPHIPGFEISRETSVSVRASA